MRGVGVYWEEEAAAPEQQQQGQDEEGHNQEGEKKMPEGHHGRVEKQVGLLPTACCVRVILPDLTDTWPD